MAINLGISMAVGAMLLLPFLMLCGCASTKPCDCSEPTKIIVVRISELVENNISAKRGIDSALYKYRLKNPDVWDDIIFDAKSQVDLLLMKDIERLCK
jgi:hypothetical protein